MAELEEPNREDAVDYLNEVKLHFQDQPKVYNRFLGIMKEFEAGSITITGVISSVSQLFHARPALIGGFNAFLPRCYKIDVEEQFHQRQRDLPPLPAQSKSKPRAELQGSAEAEPREAPEAGAPAEPVQRFESDARSYVAKIKMRFRDQPGVYREFLEILHNYQKEQRTISEVYDEVAELFQDHRDLLGEFVHFLPVPVVERAPRGVVRQPVQRSFEKRSLKRGKPGAILRGKGARVASDQRPRKVSRVSGPRKAGEELSESPGVMKTKVYSSSDRAKVAERARAKDALAKDIAFFELMARSLPTPEDRDEFVRSLSLFNHGIITRYELVLLVENLFRHNVELNSRFATFIRKRTPNASLDSALSPVDFATCRRYGPSYRALPDSYTVKTCTGRSSLADSVLNDYWVSVPTGSEDYQYFRAQRKNPHEQVLYRSEQDRYELDVMIELARSALGAMEPLVEAINGVGTEQTRAPFLLKQLRAFHFTVIDRVYGEHGRDAIRSLRANPQVAIPIVATRLKQKLEEWETSRREWSRAWCESDERNTMKLLEHQGLLFKQIDRKTLNYNALLSELHLATDPREKPPPPSRASGTGMDEGRGAAVPGHAARRLSASFEHIEIFSEIGKLLSIECGRRFTEQDVEKLEQFWGSFALVVLGAKSVECLPKLPPDTPLPLRIGAPEGLSSCPRIRHYPARSIFYADQAHAIFFRLIQVLYERLEKLKYSAIRWQTSGAFLASWKQVLSVSESPSAGDGAGVAEVAGDSAVSGEAPEEDSHGAPVPVGQTVNRESGSSAQLAVPAGEKLEGGQAEGDVVPNVAPPPLDDPTNEASENLAMGPLEQKRVVPQEDDPYSAFLKALSALLSGKIDVQQYEQLVMSIHAVHAYLFHSMPRLVGLAVRQVHTVLAHKDSVRLLELFLYEHSRSSGNVSSNTYFANAAALSGGGKLFKIETMAAKVPEMWFCVTPTAPPRVRRDLEARWLDYVDKYISSDCDDTATKKCSAFLKRNQRKMREDRAMQGMVMLNKLECRISISTFKLFYVQNTEDLVYRKGRAPRSTAAVSRMAELRSKKFKEWLERHVSQPTPESADSDALDVAMEPAQGDQGDAESLGTAIGPEAPA